ncbi:hypothetical protein [Methylomagnum ishizawai]|uniref:hypothetical protein n=1 Tax=Methylomagnum ishizawai TaxID=1760988 RepID=UPI001C33CF5F|nr:hypothetical protein [Methylomagnum ishizawai]BBL77489.1 hypothetical protein MishRS11D_45870 [Methylomagnum ishizawai]
MSIDKVIEILDKHSEVMESYVLLREIKLFLNVDHEHFHPEIRIKIYESSALRVPYHFSVSHHVKTPTQAGPYMPSKTWAESEEEAIRQAISTTTSYIKSAIAAGHEPSESWLIPDEDF